MYCEYNRHFASRFNARNEESTSFKRDTNQFENDAFSTPCAKRIKQCDNNVTKVYPQRLIKEQQNQLLQNSHNTETSFLTPVNTPADVSMINKTTKEDNLPSPYSETEDYMFSGYYQDEKIADNNWACIESVQYSLYDMTPEEYDLSTENIARNGCVVNTNNHTGSWEINEVSNGQMKFQCNFNEDFCNDSYDINMR